MPWCMYGVYVIAELNKFKLVKKRYLNKETDVKIFDYQRQSNKMKTFI